MKCPFIQNITYYKNIQDPNYKEYQPVQVECAMSEAEFAGSSFGECIDMECPAFDMDKFNSAAGNVMKQPCDIPYCRRIK
jgi:hypothetical protein